MPVIAKRVFKFGTEYFTELCKKYENFETPEWAADEILRHERPTKIVEDTACGAGVLVLAAKKAGCKNVIASDLIKWPLRKGSAFKGYPVNQEDFLERNKLFKKGTTLFINPPFSKAVEFVQQGLYLGAEKIICFQRFAWYESQERKDFWDEMSPQRIYVCGDRAACWRYDLPINERGHRYDPETGKELGSPPTAHAFYVWDTKLPSFTPQMHPELRRIYKGE